MINTIEDLFQVCGYQSEEEIDWREVSKNQKFSESFIREFKERLDWTRISRYQKLPEDLIREFQDSVCWMWISFYQKLSEDFIRECKDLVNWRFISYRQKLSESFIREFQNSVYWEWISYAQKLSETFIREFKEYVNWFWISYAQKLSKAFIEEFKDYYRESEEGRVLASEFYCGIENRPITIYSKDPTKIQIGCFVGTQSEALEAIDKKYGETELGLDYKAKVNACFETVEKTGLHLRKE